MIPKIFTAESEKSQSAVQRSEPETQAQMVELGRPTIGEEMIRFVAANRRSIAGIRERRSSLR